MSKKKRIAFLWIAGLGLFLAGLEAVSILSVDGAYGNYLHYFVYMSLANTFIPLPTNPLIIYMGREFSPLTVSILGAAGTSIANTTEYLILGTFLEYRRVKKVKNTKTYLTLKRYFEITPFLLMTVINFIPVPIDPVRWMAISVDYPRLRYITSTFLGRFPRYLLLAWLGNRYNLSNTTIMILLGITVALVLIQKTTSRIKNRDQ
jgi:membrane protein YqaA with SNARE-associated domain